MTDRSAIEANKRIGRRVLLEIQYAIEDELQQLGILPPLAESH